MGPGHQLDRLGRHSESAATGGAGGARVRTISASMCASALSLFAPDMRDAVHDSGPPASGSSRTPRIRPRPAPHPRPAVGLDPDLHLARAVRSRSAHSRAVLADQLRAAAAIPSNPREPLAGQHAAWSSDDLDVVVVFGPVITDEQHDAVLPSLPHEWNQQPAGDLSALMDQCSPTTHRLGTTPHQPFTPPDHQRGHALPTGLKRSRRYECSPASGYQPPSLSPTDPITPIRRCPPRPRPGQA